MQEQNCILKFIECLLDDNHIPFHVYDSQDDIDLETADQGLRKTIFHQEMFKEIFSGEKIIQKKLYNITDIFQCTYIMFLLPDSEKVFICGPVVFESFQGDRFDELMEKLQIPEELHDELRDYYLGVTFLSSQSFFMSIFIQLADHLFGKNEYEIINTDFGDRERQNQLYKNYFRIPDKPFLSIQMIESRYKTENRLVQAVQSGNEARAMEALTELSTSLVPARLSNELRDLKDYSITLNTILRKAAESAGVHPIHIDSLSNTNVKSIESLSSVDQCRSFQRKCIQSYCRLVHRYALNHYSPLTQKVLTYVSTELDADLSLKSLAERLSVNASYLSSLFKKEMGISLTEYVNRSRIQRAEMMLVSTDTAIKDIATQCGFSDIYYFGRLFKRMTGTTPKIYRESQSPEKVFATLADQNSDNEKLT